MKNAILKTITTLSLLYSSSALACPLIDNQVDWNCDGKLKAVFIGDSITAGSSDNGGYVRHLKEDFLQDLIVVNNGIGGINSETVKSRLKFNLYPNMLNADYVFITIGVNDFWKKRDTVSNIREMIRIINSLYIKRNQLPPVIKVNIPTLMNLSFADPSQVKRRVGQDIWIYQVGRKILKSGLPIGVRFDRVPVTPQTFKSDGLHPIAAGYKIMAEMLFDFINGTLKSSLLKKKKSFKDDMLFIPGENK